MTKKSKQQRRGESRTTKPQVTVTPGLLSIGLMLIAVAVFASGALVWQHFDGGGLPGCGPGSACAQAAGSAWGRVPLINWPISFVGLAYFIGLGAAWIAVPRAGFGILPWIVRLGAAFSILYLGVMIVGGMLCPYCIISHIANLAFLGVLETARNSQPGYGATAINAPTQRLAIAFVAASVVLGAWQLQFSQRIKERAERELEESTAAILADAADERIGSRDGGGRAFTGRYLYGPEQAPIRLVMFTNYQCIDCQRIEREVETLLASRNDVSLSIKHYPMSSDCNPHISLNMHPNSCWAARAVEAAGILGGNDRFWEMHRWIFSRNGGFTDQELYAGLRLMGYTDTEEFSQLMQSEETLRLVQEDIEEARALGLMYTPMIFINGVELRGWTTPNGVTNAVTRLAATNPQPADADEHPVSAFEKYIADWREGSIRPAMRQSVATRRLGSDSATLRIVMFGDYEEPRVAETDARIRELIADHENARYVFRHYPANEACNPRMTRTIYANSCWAHQAAEAVAILYGSEGFWRMHDWLLANQTNFNDAALRTAAPSLGIDAEAVIELMSTAEVASSMRLDIEEAQRQRLRGIPMVFINEKWLPRTHLDGYDVLGTVIEEADAE